MRKILLKILRNTLDTIVIAKSYHLLLFEHKFNEFRGYNRDKVY